jgi:hypothetical protein
VPLNWSSLVGDGSLARIGTRAAEEGACPDKLAAKVLPAVYPRQRPRQAKAYLADFPLDAVVRVLDDVEARGLTRQAAVAALGRGANPPLHPGLVRWAGNAVGAYLDAIASFDTPATLLVRDYWVVQQADNGRTWEIYAWGRRYQSPDGSVREHRFLRYGKADAERRDMSQIAIAARATAFGVPAPWPDHWEEPFRPRSRVNPAVKRVRVVEVGLGGGRPVVVFDGTPEQASALYAADARDGLRGITRGGTPQLGDDCAGCKLITVCEEIKRVPGLLGIMGPTAPQRTWSVSNGRYYQRCPAQDHLMRLHLPKQDEYSPAAERGQAVHAWLDRTHVGPLHPACTVWDIPPSIHDWSVGRWHVTGQEAWDGARMIASHADLCPFKRADQITEVRVEPRLAVLDTDANVIVIAKPDLLYLEDGAWVWREVKTRNQPLRSTEDALRDTPQLALATLFLALNVFPGKREGARVELEWLTADSGDVLLIDPNDPAEVDRAREVVRELAAPWHADKTMRARPGRHCADCPVRRWCPDAWTKESA